MAICVDRGRIHADGKPANRTAGAVLRKTETPAVEGDFWKKASINLFGLFHQRQIRRHGIRTTDYYYGTFDAGYLRKEELMATISNLEEGTSEIMCHPGYRDESFVRICGGRYLPDQELKALMDAEVQELLHKRSVHLVGFKDL